MDKTGLQSFFDLGISLNLLNKYVIVEKGHGTKIYINSANIQVTTVYDNVEYIAIMEEPKKKLHNRNVPNVNVTYQPSSKPTGTTIIIKGYNNNRRGDFTHERLKDYVKWFTKIGSIEREIGITKHNSFVLFLQGIDKN